MIYLNLGCGYPRPQKPPWVNLDNLRSVLKVGTPERMNLDAEPNYIDCDLSKGIPFGDNEVDGLFCSHMLEHLKPREGIAFFRECKRVLKEGGVLRISVPDAEFMMQCEIAGIEYCNEYRPEGMSFTEHVLGFPEHMQVTTYWSVYFFYWVAGFKKIEKRFYQKSPVPKLAELDNRPTFSLFMEGTKNEG